MKSLLTLGAIAGALTLAACGGGGSGTASGSSAAPPDAAQTVSVKPVDGVGGVLIDAAGKALYSPDEEAGGQILCTDACTSFWTPLAPGNSAPTAAPGVGPLGVITRPDGTQQVTEADKPLYTFTEDSVGDLKGNGFADDFGSQHFTWHAVLATGSPAGSSGTPSGGPSDTSSGSSSSSGSGYGY
jgi:predicted lipoprotein with Yx(FWY)xxD motif